MTVVNKTVHRATNKDNLYKFAYPEVERTTIFHRFMLSQVIH